MSLSRAAAASGQIARKFEERFADVLASQPEVVAYHFTEAGLLGIALITG
jgi:hypothetical protein